MSIRNLEFLFRPASVALIESGENPRLVGSLILRNLLSGGFTGKITRIGGPSAAAEAIPRLMNVESLAEPPDLAVIAVAPEDAPRTVSHLGKLGAKAAVVIGDGFGERGDPAGLEIRRAMLEAARPHLLRILGPNTFGVMTPAFGLNASFGHLQPLPGNIAFVAQSGAVQASVLDWAISRRIGFSHFVGLGDMADLDFGDMLDHLATEPAARAILLYMETVTNARKFMSAARAAARMKPVIVVKGGRHEEGALAAARHTGRKPGPDSVYEAAFRRAGILRVHELRELFDAVETLAMVKLPRGNRLAVLTNGGGVGVLAADFLVDQAGSLSSLSSDTLERLDSVLPPAWPRGNPVDIGSDAPASRFADALRTLMDDRETEGVLVLNSPTALASREEAARSVIEVVREAGRGARAPVVLTSWTGNETASAARMLFAERGIPTYDTPADAIRGFMQLIRYRRGQEMLMETPPSIPEEFAPDQERARNVIARSLTGGRNSLTESEAREVLEAYRIPVAAGRGAERMDDGFPTLSGRVCELSAGMSVDADFGPILHFGHGGAARDLIQDREFAFPPLNMALAKGIMQRTRVYRVLLGNRELPCMDVDAIAFTLVKISQMVCDLPEVVEIDINPIFSCVEGLVAAGAVIRVAEPLLPGSQRLSIQPYPKELEQAISLPDEPDLLLRPIRPEDEPAYNELFEALPPEDIHFRFLHPMKALSRGLAARLTQIDYDREMALVLVKGQGSQRKILYGDVRISADPDGDRAEFAIMLRRELTGTGLGPTMMRRIIEYARKREIGELYGDVLGENAPMLKLCKLFGFTLSRDPEDPGIVAISLKL